MTWPCGQVTCLASQSMVNMSAVYPPERACGEGSGSSGASSVMPRARAASSSSALAYPLSAACSPGVRPRRASVSCTGSVISTSVTGARVVSALVSQVRGRAVAVRIGDVAGLGQVHLVPGPALAAFFGVPRVGVIRRDQPGSGRREALLVPPPDHLLPACAGVQAELLDPDPAQRLHRGQLPQPARRARAVDLPQQQVAVPAVAHGQVGALGRASWQPEVIDPLPVHPLPGRVDHPGQPARRGSRQRLQCRPDTLPGQLQPVQVPDPAQHVGGIGPLRHPRPDQAEGTQPGQQRIQQRRLHRPGHQPGPELAQHAESRTPHRPAPGPGSTSSPAGPAPHQRPAGRSGPR